MKPKATPLATTLTTAATATSALFALQSQADASIIYSGPQNLTAGPVAGYPGSGTSVQKNFLMAGATLRLEAFRLAIVNNYAQALLFGPDLINTGGAVAKLAAGGVISAGKPFSTGGVLASFIGGVQQQGHWAKNQTGFAGIKLPNGDLGWVRLVWNSTDANPGPTEVTAVDWAYDTTPGEAINAGAVPEPGTTALLALAGAGAAFLRRRKG